MDEDLEQVSREQLVAEVKRLRQGIRQLRDSTGHALGVEHPALWGLLPEAVGPLPTVPDWPQFLRNGRQLRAAHFAGVAGSRIATGRIGGPPRRLRCAKEMPAAASPNRGAPPRW